MATVADRSTVAVRHTRTLRPLHPVHLVFLAGTLPLFLGALLCDIAYAQTYHIQWGNFASWLIVGGLAFGAVALLAALFGFAARDRRAPRHGLYVLLVLATWIAGFFDALVHAKDAWAMMPEGLVLSILSFVLAVAAVAVGFASVGTLRAEVRP